MNQGPQIESFDSFINRIKKIYANDPSSPDLDLEMAKWLKRRMEETDRRYTGDSALPRIDMEIELAQIYIATKRWEDAMEILRDAEDEADGMRSSEHLEKIDELIRIAKDKKTE